MKGDLEIVHRTAFDSKLSHECCNTLIWLTNIIVTKP